VTTAALPAPRRHPFARKLADWAQVAARAVARRAWTPHKAALASLADIPLTVAGLGCIDAGVFVANMVAGLIVTGVSLMWLEHLIADEK
jgi:hypothetical protein